MVLLIKCRKCRHELVRESAHELLVLCAHGKKIDSESDKNGCCSVDQDSVWFLEDSGTKWISDSIEKAGWTKGRLNCLNCEARVGSFDFVSQSTCACGNSVLPAVHLVKSKVDCSSLNSNLLMSLKTEAEGFVINKNKD